MPAFNAEAYIADALESLFAQTRTDFEVIVIDDGSQDATLGRVKAVVQNAGPKAPPVRLLTQKNAGPAAARNYGVAVARADLIGFLDADDRWAPTKVARQLALMASAPEVVLSFSGFSFIDAAGTDLCETMLPTSETISHAVLLERNQIHTSTAIVCRVAFEKAGGFDETLRTYEDFDLWLRLVEAAPEGIRAICADLADYRRHGIQATGSWQHMHAGWQRVVERQAARHPETWAQIAHLAWGEQLEYCASLAYNAGNIADMRRLMWRCWREGGLRMVTRPYALLMSGICLATFLPRALQIVLGRGFIYLRRCRRWFMAF